MKKVLLTTLAIAVAMAGFAQKGQERVKAEQPRSAKANITALGKYDAAPALNFTPSTSVPRNIKGDDLSGWQTMRTLYDLQTNKIVGNRMYRFEDGTLGVTATMGQTPSAYSDRGTGYDYYNGTAFIFEEEENPVTGRIESMKTGWPSYCQYGPKGEIVVSHTGSNLVYYTREIKGEGEWQGPNEIPNPVWLGTSDSDMTWPRVVTTGPDHDILHVIAAASDDNGFYLFYSRSTDGENWTTTFVPTLEEGEQGKYSADSYVMAANGDNVAIMLLSIMGHGYIIKSTDNGETWTKSKFWDNPYADFDWETDENSLFGYSDDITINDVDQYGPDLGTICIDNDGIVHGAFSGHKYAHLELGSTYTYWYSRTLDGVFYWNETMGTLQGPEWVCPDDGTVIPSDPHNICRMWWPTDETGEYIVRNFESANLIGFLTPDDHFSEFSSDNWVVTGYFQSPAASPAICVDESGTVAVAYSVPDLTRPLSNDNKYLRSIMVSFIEPGYVMGDATGNYSEIPGNCYYEWVKLQDADEFLHSYDEAIYPICPTNTANEEFWFGYQADDTPGLNSGSNAQQGAPSDNYIWVQKVIPDYEGLGISENPAVNPMTATRVYPNPATDVLNIEVNASQASEMSISVFNIMGQNVMNQTVSINTGINTRPVSISELNSGVYFVTVKANGFENTMKFIVK
ncbi:MAG: T9SS type A sorting domain-containing protein [Bacteroidales bacterium]|nr:T9SS type A sorting domain-containing protein [Bacteroidales bacterium]MBR6930887.1 T9SS type A sorting domain-containing protein [Bacteroidales bacterium]